MSLLLERTDHGGNRGFVFFSARLRYILIPLFKKKEHANPEGLADAGEFGIT